MKTQSALPWFGSDSEVAEQLAALLDHCRHVTIPFCGGLGILPYLKAKAIIANDAHEQAINFYRYASGIYGEVAQSQLFERCQHTLSHPAEMDSAQSILAEKSRRDSADAAWAFWAVCWLGRKGKGGCKNQDGKPSIRRTASGGSNSSRVRAAADDLPEWAKQFERCEWECKDFRDVLIKTADDETCGLYIDAPWDQLGDGYLHSFTDRDHVHLRQGLERFQKTTVLVRYGDTPLIRDLYVEWQIIEAESRNQANAVKGELWMLNRRNA